MCSCLRLLRVCSILMSGCPRPVPAAGSPRPTSAGSEDITRGQLTIHADRGAAMTSTNVALLLAELGVTKTHSRPQLSNDTPYSRSPVQDAHVSAHLPDALRLHGRCPHALHRILHLVQRDPSTQRPGPAYAVRHAHHGRSDARRAQRAVVLTADYQATPDRFVNTPPVPAALPTAACINPPSPPPTAPAAQ